MNPLTNNEGNLRILITGATGGIGSALVHQLLLRHPGAKVYATGRRQEGLDALLDTCGEDRPRLTTIVLDALDEDALVSLSNRIKEESGGLDVCIHTIGALHGEGLKAEKSLRDLSLQTLLHSFSVNTVSFLLLAKHLHKLFRHEHPTILAAISAKVGSIGDNQLGGWYSYRASKAALNMAVRNVALEYTRTGCKTTTVSLHPGTTETVLSKPFTGAYPADKLATPAKTAERLVDVLSKVASPENGQFLNWDGTTLPW